MKRISVIFIFLLLVFWSIGSAQSRNGTVTPDGYLGKITLAFDAGFESASGDHTNITDGERQDLGFNSLNLGAGLLYPATQTVSFRLNLAFINSDTNWEGNIFMDEQDFDLSGFKLNFGVRLYLK